MKLTNKQLTVVVEAIAKKVKEKVDKYVASTEGVKKFADFKKKKKFAETSKILKEYEDNVKKIEALKEKNSELKHKYLNITKQVRWAAPETVKALEEQLENEFKREEFDKYPERQDIEAQVVLASMNGSENLIEIVMKELKI